MTPLHSIWQAQYDALRLLYTDGKITAATFRDRLIKLGFKKGPGLEAEVALHHPPSPGMPVT